MKAREALADGVVRLVLVLDQDSDTAAMWPNRCELTLAVTVTEALHTYFHVGDVTRASVTGLEDAHYMDKANGGGYQTQVGAVTVSGEVDRVYLSAKGECVIHDPVLGRRIRITKEHARSTVVWNPWIEKGAKFGDMGIDGYRHMLCVESANALSDAQTIQAGASHTLTTEYRVERDG